MAEGNQATILDGHNAEAHFEPIVAGEYHLTLHAYDTGVDFDGLAGAHMTVPSTDATFDGVTIDA